MTDRHSGYYVILEKDMREDDAQAIINAIKMIKGVLTVEPKIGGYESLMSEERARHNLGKRLFSVLYPESGRK